MCACRFSSSKNPSPIASFPARREGEREEGREGEREEMRVRDKYRLN